MADELGGTSTAKVPAWKLRQQQQQQRRVIPPPPPNNDLGGGRSRSNYDELGGTRSPSMNQRLRSGQDALGGGKTSHGARVPAWKLREQMKDGGGSDLDDTVGTSSTGSSSNYSCHPSRRTRPVSRVPGAPDPSLPPAFRAAFNRQQERKKNKDDFLSMSSVHSKSNNTNSSDSYGTLESDSDDENDSFDGEDSFASLGSDADEDDDAYRESRNQLARLEIEKQRQSKVITRGAASRLKKKSLGVHGIPLDFIAE